MEGREGEDDAVREDCPTPLWPSKSPLSEVAVVRLVPEPLLSLGIRSLSFAGTGGGIGIGDVLPHSVPLAAACAKTCRRRSLLSSN